MTRRQWMWLWIWLLLFFIIFCVWNKLQSIQTSTKPAVNPVVITPEPAKQAIPADAIGKVAQKDITMKIVKDKNTVKLSGVFPSQEAVDKALEALKATGDSVEKGTIIIDKAADNPALLEKISALAKDLGQYQDGYIEYHEHTLSIDGIVSDVSFKDNLSDTASHISSDITITNNSEVENTPSQKAQAEQAAKEKAEAAAKEAEQNEAAAKKAAEEKAKAQAQAQKSKATDQAQKELDKLLKNQRVEFVYAKDVLTAKSKHIIDQLVAILKKHPDIHIEVGGHTDSDGTAQNNLKLSQKRADAIKRYLSKHGISKERLKAIGYGESKPLVKNDTAKHKQINRRVEFKVIK